MAKFRVHSVAYKIGVDLVTIAVRPDSGMLTQAIVDLYTSQAALEALASEKNASTWGDAEVVAEAERLLGQKGEELTPDMLGLKSVDGAASA